MNGVCQETGSLHTDYDGILQIEGRDDEGLDLSRGRGDGVEGK